MHLYSKMFHFQLETCTCNISEYQFLGFSSMCSPREVGNEHTQIQHSKIDKKKYQHSISLWGSKIVVVD